MLALEKQVWQEKRTALSIQQNSDLKFRKFLVPILVAQTRPKPPRVWLLFLWAGYKTAVRGTIILSNGKGHSGPTDRPKWPDRSKWTTFKTGPEYSGRTKPKWSVPFDVPTEISGILGWIESAQEDWLVQTLGLRRPQRVGISWERLCLLLDQQGDRRRLCLQGDPNTDQKFISLFIITT